MSEQMPPCSVLIVEDDEKLSDQMARLLTQYEYTVEQVYDGEKACERIAITQPDVVILDLMLPGQDGFAVCRSVRPDFKGGILFLTASDDDIDHVTGLEMGADDFLVKPIHPRVLLAHIRVLQRKLSLDGAPEAEQSRELTFGGLVVHTVTRQVTLNHDVIDLTPAEFDILVLLARNAERIVSRDVILKQLRGIEYDGFDRSVDVKVSALRKKLGDDSQRPVRIITVRAKGYLFVPDAW